MKNELLTISLRQNAIFLGKNDILNSKKEITETTAVLMTNVGKLGFTFSEPLLHALNGVHPSVKIDILEHLKQVLGVANNWTPLVKGWDTPTGETFMDHLKTFMANVFQTEKGTKMQCGHIIPDNTFPLERYNGCPFCGTPFVFGEIEKYGQGSKLKVLELWSETEMNDFFVNLLQSKTALDATQIDSLKILVKVLTLPKANITMKETMMIVINGLVEKGDADKAQAFFSSPADVLRYLWYKKTGFLQLVEPKTIVTRNAKNNTHFYAQLNTSLSAKEAKKAALKLKYSRTEAANVAKWLNNIELDAQKSCEIMHPKRGMWVRFIRALRLAEYSKRKEFGRLAEILDVFYKQTYTVWQGNVDHFKLKQDAAKTFGLLKQRPGLFARSLFANMLWFGPDETIEAFTEIVDKVPARLMFTLNMYAQNYFDKNASRSVKPLGGTNKVILANRLLQLYDDAQLEAMKSKIENLCLIAMKKRFAAQKNENKTIFIDEMLYKMPVSIGDRSDTVQDLPTALMGTKFPIEGSQVRLFLQWGVGLPAQHLDMDLSCQIAYEDKLEVCSYFSLDVEGCKHSGDIRSIPDQIGTAEYIEIDTAALKKTGAKYVTFTCNAYSNGSLSPNLVVGWMNSKFPMAISETTGVAYDPSCVQHQVRITQSVAKGLVFGVLDVEKNEITWLEMTFGGQTVLTLDKKGVHALLSKLDSKLSVGNLLALKAEAQHLEIVALAEQADEKYDLAWARNSAAVTQLLVD
jgi:hypothetical protein